MTAMERNENILRESLGFKKRWLQDKSGWWLERKFKHPILGMGSIYIDDNDITFSVCLKVCGREDIVDIKKMKFSFGKIDEIIKFLEA